MPACVYITSNTVLMFAGIFPIHSIWAWHGSPSWKSALSF